MAPVPGTEPEPKEEACVECGMSDGEMLESLFEEDDSEVSDPAEPVEPETPVTEIKKTIIARKQIEESIVDKLIREMEKVYGPVEFFLTVMAMDMLAPEYGKHTLKEYFTNLNNTNA